MNTTSSTFKANALYNVQSNNAVRPASEHSFSVAIIPRSQAAFISPLLDEVSKLAPQEIILFNSRLVPQGNIPIRNIWLNNEVSSGQLVNIAIEEAKSKFVLVLWSDMRFLGAISLNVFLRIEERSNLCVTPQLFNAEGLKLPCLSAPAFDSNGFSIILDMNEQNETQVFLPLDFAGAYNRSRFLNLGGYDNTISNSYWQRADFAMRSAMWGERIVLNPALTITYNADHNAIEEEDSFGLSTLIFALKNLGVSINKNRVTLPFWRMLWLNGTRGKLTLFNEIKEWVHHNRLRFRYNAEQVVDNWQG